MTKVKIPDFVYESIDRHIAKRLERNLYTYDFSIAIPGMSADDICSQIYTHYSCLDYIVKVSTEEDCVYVSLWQQEKKERTIEEMISAMKDNSITKEEMISIIKEETLTAYFNWISSRWELGEGDDLTKIHFTLWRGLDKLCEELGIDWRTGEKKEIRHD